MLFRNSMIATFPHSTTRSKNDDAAPGAPTTSSNTQSVSDASQALRG